jgi:hypothetical protein
MHRPGYVQGGQEVECGYLLLGIHYRRIPGDIVDKFSGINNRKFSLIIYSKAGFAYDWISLIADVGGWTGTLIGIRYALYVEKILVSFENSFRLLQNVRFFSVQNSIICCLICP